MEEPFILEVDYKGTVVDVPAQLHLLGYLPRFVVALPQTDVWFERDEEGLFRALLPPDAPVNSAQLDVGLLEAIAAKIEAILA